MAARDDSVIRGSLIACLIFLVLSLALNFLFWRWGNLAAQDSVAMEERLTSAQNDLRKGSEQIQLMKAMLGVGSMSDAQFELLSQSSSGDPDMELIEQNYIKDMAILGPEAEAQDRNYHNIPEFLVNAIRSRNEQFGQAREEATTIRTQADSDVNNARLAQTQAEKNRDDETKKLEMERSQFADDRERMKSTTEETRDQLTTIVQDMNILRKQKADEISKLSLRSSQLVETVDTQRLELNRLRSDQFESVQGLVTFVNQNVITINLGSADDLRTGVTFGIIDGDETRLQDARVKASVQVTKILGEHLAEARVVLMPEIRYPIIPGDQIWSPFWAPGRQVKIAILGDIDIDGDDRPDTEALKGMITAAGATVAAVIGADGEIEGTLDSSVRFLVYGETLTIGDGSNTELDEAAAAAEAKVGRVKDQAGELGITVIPSWKLQAYLKTINDSLTTPLGSAVRGKDFPPDAIPPGTQSRLPTNLPQMYQKQLDNVQRNNTIARP